MKEQYQAQASVTVSLQCQVEAGTQLPDIRALLSSQFTHPLIVGHTTWEQPRWERCHAPWPNLEQSPFEPDDMVIHVCHITAIRRALLARVVEDEQNPVRVRLVYLPRAEEEGVERAVWKHMQASYPFYREGLYPCPPELVMMAGEEAERGVP